MLGSVGVVFLINLIVMVTMSIKGLKRKLFLKSLRKKAIERSKFKQERKQKKKDAKRIKQI